MTGTHTDTGAPAPEVFRQGRLYGVMVSGKVTCPARFKSISHLQDGCGFFVLATYMVRDAEGRLEEVTTVIDLQGRDLKVMLRGEVSWCNGYFCGVVTRGHYPYVTCWDPVGNAYYHDTHPEFHVVAGVEIGWGDEHVPSDCHCMRLRRSTGRVSPRFYEWEMFYNRDIIIARDYLIVKKDRNHSYRISGYLDDSVLVENDKEDGYLQIFLNGRKGQLFRKKPEGYKRMMNMGSLGLQRVKTGR